MLTPWSYSQSGKNIIDTIIVEQTRNGNVTNAVTGACEGWPGMKPWDLSGQVVLALRSGGGSLVMSKLKKNGKGPEGPGEGKDKSSVEEEAWGLRSGVIFMSSSLTWQMPRVSGTGQDSEMTQPHPYPPRQPSPVDMVQKGEERCISAQQRE